MTWFKVDDGFYDHPKVRAIQPRLLANCVALWTLAGAYCARHETDGNLPRECLGAVVSWSRKVRERAAEELCRVGLWESTADGWRFHEWDRYQPSKAHLQERRAKTAERVKRHRNRVTTASSNDVTQDSRARVPTRPDPTGGDPPSPPSPSRPAKRDPMALARDRLDVQRIFERWKQTFGYDRATLGAGGRSPDADILADAIDEHGEQACLDALELAPADGMVSGKQDDKGKPHESIRYIFGNADTLRRLLRAADEAKGRSARQKSAAELYEEYARR